MKILLADDKGNGLSWGAGGRVGLRVAGEMISSGVRAGDEGKGGRARKARLGLIEKVRRCQLPKIGISMG
jgi:hypothetical protein